MTIRIIRGNALALPLADDSVDLVVTSPPYFGLRSYQDGGEHYDGQVGSEATPAEFVDALVAATREMVRVTKPTGSIWVNLGDKYASYEGNRGGGGKISGRIDPGRNTAPRGSGLTGGGFVQNKSLMGLPWRYAIRCMDELGLILRAEVIWDKPNGLPESVRDRVRRSHEQWFHFTLSPRYYANVDEVREPHTGRLTPNVQPLSERTGPTHVPGNTPGPDGMGSNPLGKIPGSVWRIATQPLRVPAELGIDHFAAFPMEWPRRIITGWSPPGVCTACGEGRRAVANVERRDRRASKHSEYPAHHAGHETRMLDTVPVATITGYACACSTPDAPTVPAVVLDPFGGTGTTALVADVLGRDGISVDLSADYCRLAEWRTADPKERARVLKKKSKRAEPPPVKNETTLW